MSWVDQFVVQLYRCQITFIHFFPDTQSSAYWYVLAFLWLISEVKWRSMYIPFVECMIVYVLFFRLREGDRCSTLHRLVNSSSAPLVGSTGPGAANLETLRGLWSGGARKDRGGVQCGEHVV